MNYEKYEQDPSKFECAPPKFTNKDEIEKQKLLSEGFSNWSKKDFFHYLKCCERYGRNDYDMILEEMTNKTREELDSYSKIFWSRWEDMKNGDRYLERVEKAETIIFNNLKKTIGWDLKRSKKNLAKLLEDDDFTEEEDEFILNSLYKYGYGSWELIKVDIRNSSRFRFNWRFLTK